MDGTGRYHGLIPDFKPRDTPEPAEGSNSALAAGSVTLSREELSELYSQAYNRGHDDTVDGGYTHVLPVDYPTYFAEEIDDWLNER